MPLAERGVTAAIYYLIDEKAAYDTLAKVEERGAQGMVIRTDVSRPEALKDMQGQISSKWGGLDNFVNNALEICWDL